MKSSDPWRSLHCRGNYDWMNSAHELQGQWTRYNEMRRWMTSPPRSMTTTNHPYKKDEHDKPQQELLGTKLTHCWPVVLLPKLRHTELQQVVGPLCHNLPSHFLDIHKYWEARSLTMDDGVELGTCEPQAFWRFDHGTISSLPSISIAERSSG